MHTAHAVAHTMQTRIQEVIQVVNVSWCPTRILTGALALLHASLPIGICRKQRTKNDVSLTNYYLEIVNGSTHSTASLGFCPKMLLNLTKSLMFSLTLISRDHSNNKRSRGKHLSFNGAERKITQGDEKIGWYFEQKPKHGLYSVNSAVQSILNSIELTFSRDSLPSSSDSKEREANACFWHLLERHYLILVQPNNEVVRKKHRTP